MNPPDYKAYLGDAVHAQFDGYHVVLTTSDGICVTNKIYLEPAVIGKFCEYLKVLREELNRLEQPLVPPVQDPPQ